jgi:hypothetical protein
MVGAVTSVAGVIGFVGLVVAPHLVRAKIGSARRDDGSIDAQMTDRLRSALHHLGGIWYKYTL